MGPGWAGGRGELPVGCCGLAVESTPRAPRRPAVTILGLGTSRVLASPRLPMLLSCPVGARLKRRRSAHAAPALLESSSVPVLGSTVTVPGGLAPISLAAVPCETLTGDW